MKIEQKLDDLKRINKVDAPPFLFTRVAQRIVILNDPNATMRVKWAFGAGVLILWLINMGVVLTTPKSNGSESVAEVISAMNLAPSNDLYHE